MGKSKQLNEDIKNITKLMGYDRGLTSVENNRLFEERRSVSKPQQSKLLREGSYSIDFENYGSGPQNFTYSKDNAGNYITEMPNDAWNEMARGLEDALDGCVDDEDVTNAWQVFAFVSDLFTPQGKSICDIMLDYYDDQTGGVSIESEITTAGENPGYIVPCYWSDDDAVSTVNGCSTYGCIKKKTLALYKACGKGWIEPSTDEEIEVEENVEGWPKNLSCVISEKGTWKKTSAGLKVHIVQIDETKAAKSDSLDSGDQLVYYPDGNSYLYKRGCVAADCRKGPFPYNCGDLNIAESVKTIFEQFDNIDGVFIDFGDPEGTTDTDDPVGDVDADQQTDVVTPTKPSGPKYTRKDYTCEDVLSGEVCVQFGDVIKDEDGIIWRIQEIIGAKTDGVFGPNTKKAVELYQRRNGLEVDGIFCKEEAELAEICVDQVQTDTETEVIDDTDIDNNDPNSEEVTPKEVEVIKKEITTDSDVQETLEYLKDVRGTKLDETQCIQLVVAANGALPNVVPEILPKLQACFYDYNFPRGIGRRAVKKRYNITGKGRKR